LLLAELEQFAVKLAVERCVWEEQKRGAGVHNQICVLAEVFRRLADHGHAAEVLAHSLDRSERAFEQLLVLHVGKDLFDQYMLWHAQILWVVDNLVDAAKNPDHQRFDEVGILLVVDTLEVEALQPRHMQAVLHVVEDRVVDALVLPLRHVAIEMFGQCKISEPSHRLREVVDPFDGLEHIVVVFRTDGRSRVCEQELDEGVEESDVSFGRLKRERIDARSILADSINLVYAPEQK